LFGQGLFMIKVSGRGDLFINTFGAIDRHKLGPGEMLVVDNFHLVAFTDTCNYKVTKFGGLKDTLLGGEGLVTEITGPGEILIQTKNIREFTEMIWPSRYGPCYDDEILRGRQDERRRGDGGRPEVVSQRSIPTA